MQEWPPLPYAEWRDTLETLHMYSQILGKLRLALSPFEPQWANVALYLTARGLGSSSIPHASGSFDVEFDFIDHQVVIRTSDGGTERIGVHGQSVAQFYAQVRAALSRLAVEVVITELPQEVPEPIPFPQDEVHHSYDAGCAHRFWQVLRQVDVVMKRYRAQFQGKTSPVHFFWGSFDLATTRFSGLPAEPPPGAGPIMLKAEDAEQISVGFWAGDQRSPFPAFYAYGYPKPDGCAAAECRPDAAAWVESAGLFVFPYEDMRTSRDPAGALTEFLESSYRVCAELMGWSPDLVRHHHSD